MNPKLAAAKAAIQGIIERNELDAYVIIYDGKLTASDQVIDGAEKVVVAGHQQRLRFNTLFGKAKALALTPGEDMPNEMFIVGSQLEVLIQDLRETADTAEKIIKTLRGEAAESLDNN